MVKIVKKNSIIIFIVLTIIFLIIIGACYFYKFNIKEFAKEKFTEISNKFCDDKCQINKIIADKELAEEIYKKTEIKQNNKISSYEWVDDEHTCFRVRLDYENKPEDVVDNYSGDYFFIINNGKVQQVIFSDYSDKNISSSGEHNAYFEDVTFDSDKDLIVGLRCGTANCFSRAYIFNDGKYEYTPSFEEIPNYKINNENSEILGFSKDSACNYTYYHYNYVNTKFEEGYKYERNACLEQ